MEFLLTLHGHNRWLVVAAWGLSLVLLMLSPRKSIAPWRPATLAFGALLGIVALQFVLGVVLFVWKWQAGGSIPHYRWEHVVLMVLALGALHMPLRWRRLPAPQWQRRTAWILLLAGALIFLGVARLPKGWLG